MELLNIYEYELAARERLTRPVYDFAANGSGDQATLRANREAFEQWRLLPRVMRGAGAADCSTSVLGTAVSMPVLLAPVGLQRLLHHDGELASARAAREAGTIFTLSTTATTSIEDVASVAGPWWFQLYLYRDRGISRELVQRAEQAGASAIVLTVDTTALGRREADERNRFALPDTITLANFSRLDHDRIGTERGSGLTAYTSANFEPAISWEDLDWLTGETRLPVAVKGILAPDDARLALEHGARAVVVSNHGGRQLDGAVATLDALPAVVAAVGGRAEVLLDGGVRRGTDVLKALGLGASAVLVGRPFLWGLAVDGQAGVAQVLELLRAELQNAQILCGCSSLRAVDRALVVPAGPLGGVVPGRV